MSLFQRKRLNEAERAEILDVSRLAQSYRFIATHLKGNTALVPGGQKVLEQYEAMAKLIDGVKNSMVSQRLSQLGYPQGVNFTVNLKTGKITQE